MVRDIAGLVDQYPGGTPVRVELKTSMGSKLLELGHTVEPLPGLIERLRALGCEFVSLGGATDFQSVAYMDETNSADGYWICAVVLEAERIPRAMYALQDIALEAASKYDLRRVPELHGYDLFHREDEFSSVPISGCVEIYRAAVDALAQARPMIVLKGVQRDRIVYQHPHRVAWRYAIERVDELIDSGPVLVVADEHAELEHHLRDDLQSYIRNGTGGWKPRRLDKIMPSPRFVSSGLDVLLQAADLTAFLHQRRERFPMERDFRQQLAREDLWTRISPFVAATEIWVPQAA